VGLFDKLKAAVNFVTGGAAKVQIEYTPHTAVAGQPINVKVTATGTAEVNSGGIFVDLRAVEKVSVSKRDSIELDNDLNLKFETFEQEFKIAEAFVLAKDETKVFEGTITMPANVQPSFNGKYVSHEWEIRGRVEAKGNDPDSGYQPMKVNPE
jgi:sporulation-control protein spo0M